jgi:hypothetical protein
MYSRAQLEELSTPDHHDHCGVGTTTASTTKSKDVVG